MKSKKRLYSKNVLSPFIGMGSLIIIFTVIATFWGTGIIKEIPIELDQLITDLEQYEECEPENWHIFKKGPFRIKTPSNYFFYRSQGVDSYIGGVTNKIDTIKFDFGLYCSHPSNIASCQLLDSIKNGSQTTLLFSNHKYENHIGAFVSKKNEKKALKIESYETSNIAEVTEILKNIKLK